MQASQNLAGKKAPLFKGEAVFPDGSVDTFELKDYIGQNIVIYFYPMDNSYNCTIQAKKFRDEIKKLENKGIMVVGVSHDSVELALPYPLISDVNKKNSIAKKYKTHGWLFDKRHTFLINKKGIVFKVFDSIDLKNQVDDIVTAFATQK
jgi:thioredoxin-dependent peroxiredoxin